MDTFEDLRVERQGTLLEGIRSSLMILADTNGFENIALEGVKNDLKCIAFRVHR